MFALSYSNVYMNILQSVLTISPVADIEMIAPIGSKTKGVMVLNVMLIFQVGFKYREKLKTIAEFLVTIVKVII